VTPPPSAQGRVDATGTRRRLRALAAIGYTRPQLATRLHETPSRISYLLTAPAVATVPAALDARARLVYDELWHPWPEGPAAARARAAARRRGWAVPMAWDDHPGHGHGIDDPAAVPAPGWQRPRRHRWNAADLADEATDLITRHGCTRRQAADRLGVTTEAIKKALSRTPPSSTEEDTHHAA
jgi:hypothetical protein